MKWGIDLNRLFSIENIQFSNRYTEKNPQHHQSANQIKMGIGYYHNPVRMAHTENSKYCCEETVAEIVNYHRHCEKKVS